MDGGRNHAAAGSKSENARVSLRRVRAGSVEAIDGDVRDARRRNRPDAASGRDGGLAAGGQAANAGGLEGAKQRAAGAVAVGTTFGLAQAGGQSDLLGGLQAGGAQR